MSHEIKRPLKKLGNKEFADDIKRYIRHSHNFYETKVPEMKVLAKRLHEEYELKDFYKVFDKFWNSGYHSEKALAIRTLNLYKEDFNLETWEFLKPKVMEIRAWEEIDSVGANLVGLILLKAPELEIELMSYAKGRNLWLKRISMISLIPTIKRGRFEPALNIVQENLNTKEEPIQKANGILLREIGEIQPEILKDILAKNPLLPKITFIFATENKKELRKSKDSKILRKSFKKIWPWRK